MTTQPHKLAKVTGPPGTGKTTYLLGLLEQAAKKYDPARIGAVSLTNAAVEEMRSRVKKHTKVIPRYIKTIHATCFDMLGLNTKQVADKKLKEFNKACPQWQMLLIGMTEDDHYSQWNNGQAPADNSKRFREIQILRHAMVPEFEWEKTLRDMYYAWKMWMYDNGYVDFTSMLEMVHDQEKRPDIDILLVDEAQDISRLSMNVLQMWGKGCKSTVYVGDSDQAILRFAGAVPEAFIGLDHTWSKVLEKSYRVPKKVHEYAMSIIKKAGNREEISYKPTDVEGKVYSRRDEPDLGLEGTHMILGRCNYHLNKWRNYLVGEGIAFHNPYRPGDKAWNPMKTKIWRAARNYIKFKNGEELDKVEFKNMVLEMSIKGNLIRGAKKEVESVDRGMDLFAGIALGIFTDEFLTFKKEVGEVFKIDGGTQSGKLLKMAGEGIGEEPRVIVGTIHSIKGGECDHVWIDVGTSWECKKAMVKDKVVFWDECRVGYVGVTRAIKSVGLLHGEGVIGERVW